MAPPRKQQRDACGLSSFKVSPVKPLKGVSPDAARLRVLVDFLEAEAQACGGELIFDSPKADLLLGRGVRPGLALPAVPMQLDAGQDGQPCERAPEPPASPKDQNETEGVACEETADRGTREEVCIDSRLAERLVSVEVGLSELQGVAADNADDLSALHDGREELQLRLERLEKRPACVVS